MKYALLYSYDPTSTGPSEEEYPDWIAFDQKVKDADAFVYEAGFHDSSAAKTISTRAGATNTTSGPVAGTVIAGFYVVEVASEEEAITWAQQIPTAKYGAIEVRQIVEM
jgi:hypothetical protein